MEYRLQEEAIQTIFQMVITSFIFLIQFGFTFLQAGSVRPRNTQSILFQSCMGFMIDTVVWWLLGYGLAFGKDYQNAIGTSEFLLFNTQDNSLSRDWLKQWSFMVTSTTIVAGCASERMTVLGFFLFTMFQAGWIYPVLVHWCWGQGFLQDLGYIDGAGGVVHMCGGLCGLMVLLFVGARYNRFNPNEQEQYKALNIVLNDIHYQQFTILGTWMLLVGFSYIKIGIIISPFSNGDQFRIPRSCINAAVSASSSAMVVLLLQWVQMKYQKAHQSFNLNNNSIRELCYGMLAGIVGLSASQGDDQSEYACIIGVLSGIVQWNCSKLLIYIKIDDPADGVSTHFACGSLSLITKGLFHRKKGLILTGNAYLLGVQILSLFIFVCWICVNCFFILLLLKKLGILIESEEVLKDGFDIQYFGGESQNVDFKTMQSLRQIQRKLELQEIKNKKPCSKVIDLFKDPELSSEFPIQQGITE